AGYDGRIDANGGLDPLFHSHIKGAMDAGLHVGVYVYSYAKTPAAAVVAAKETLKLVKPYQLAYPIAFDIEDTMYQSMDKATNTEIAKAFLSTVEQAGYYGILYTYKNFAEVHLDMAKLAQFDVWIAQYAAKCTYQGKYGIWQYSGSGQCSGVSGACDLNLSYKDYAQIIRNAKLNGFGASTSDTVPAADYEKLKEQYDALHHDHQVLQVDYDELAKRYDAKSDEADQAKKELEQIKRDIAALAQKWKV
ncbi:MAG TPA: hypothetical protein GX499_04190, partial [Clostridiales bacterium]|nr:hypothetical protein [Clostridiales bacterium]